MAGNYLFISGQLGLDPLSQDLPGNVTAQAELAMKNVGAILAKVGLDYNNLVKVTLLLSDIKDFAVVNEVYSRFFNDEYPARAAYAAAGLPRGALIEIEAIAYRD